MPPEHRPNVVHEVPPEPERSTHADAEAMLGLLAEDDDDQPITETPPATGQEHEPPETDDGPDEGPEADDGGDDDGADDGPDDADGTPKTDPATGQQEQPSFEIDIDGEKQSVTLDELKGGYLRTRDYKAKTAELADQRRSFEAERDTRLQRLGQLAEEFQAMDPAVLAGLHTDWAAWSNEDQQAAQTAWFAFQDKLGKHQQRMQALAREQADLRAAYFERENELLLEHVPEWKDPETGQRELSEIKKFLKDTYRYTDEELKVIPNHKAARVVRDLYRLTNELKTLKAEREKAKDKIANPRPTRRPLAPGVNRDKRNTRDLSTREKRLRAAAREGSIEAGHSLILGLLDGED